MTTIRVAAIQIAPDLSGAAGTLDRLEAAVAKASEQGGQLAVFPETFVPYYPYFSFVEPPVSSGKEHQRLYQEAVEVPGVLTERLANAAASHGMVLVVGVNERDEGSLYSAQLIFDTDGRLALKRRKIPRRFTSE